MFRPSDCDPPQAIFVRLGRQIENFGQKSPREKSRDWLAQRGFCPILRFGLSVAADKAKYAFCRPIKGESPAKRNHEFESNPLRQPVSLCFSLGDVSSENSILPPRTREYRMDKHLMFVSNGQQGWQSACISPRQGRAVEFRKLNSTSVRIGSMCLYFSETGTSSGVSHDKLNHRFALTALRQLVSCFSFS